MNWHETIEACHTAVTNQVRHYERLKTKRFFVWQEDGAIGSNTDNMRGAAAVSGSTDLFTNIEFDPWCELLEAQFNAAGISWFKSLVAFEENSIIHHEWSWEVPNTG